MLAVRCRIVFSLAMVCLMGCAASAPPPPVHTAEVQSATFSVDRFYRSMEGPIRHAPLALRPGEPAELAWIRAVEVDAVDADGNELESQENLCHAQLRSSYSGDEWVRHDDGLFHGTRMLPEKWFDLVAGQPRITLPEGFGIPMMTDEPLNAMFMILNQDPNFVPFDMALQMQVDYVLDRDLETPMTSLTKTGFDTVVYMNMEEDAQHHEGGQQDESCGLSSHEVAGTQVGTPQGVPTTHWIVPPGRHVYRNDYTLSNDITAHYFSAHLHVYGESIELRDKETGETVFESRATANDKHTTVAKLTDLSSPEGVVLHGGRTYELVTTYDNTTEHNIDAMGVVYMYVANDRFDPAL